MKNPPFDLSCPYCGSKNVNITLPANKSPEDFIGKFVNCKITKSKLTVLYGEIKDVIS